jgi:acetolactate synthase-1/2/3 large subunit
VKKTAASLLRHALEQLGVRFTFGIPGVHNIEIYDELASSETIEPVLVTHEMCGSFMADAVGRCSDQVGTLVVVPAAGITHSSSGIGEAFLDGIPMLVISGGIRTDLDKAFQLHDVDQQALLAPITKATFRVQRHKDVIPTVYKAYDIATSGEPGPVYIEIPANLQLLTGEVDELPSYQPGVSRACDQDLVEQAARKLVEAKHPGLFVGWGCRHSGEQVARIAELLGAPVATTLQGLSTLPGTHPLHVGMGTGPSSVPAARNAFANCDCMLAVATRFAEICTGSYGMQPPSNLIHVDINPDVFNVNYPAAMSIEGDAREVLTLLLAAIERLLAQPRDYSALASTIAADKQAYKASWLAHDSKDRVNPALLFEQINQQLDMDAIIACDDGNHTFLAVELLKIPARGLFISPTDFNCMGYCVPASMAACLVNPGRQVVGIVGDGAFQMSAMELLNASSRKLGLVMLVFNDGELSQIAQAQQIPYNRKTCTVVPSPDYQALAKALGCAFVRIASNDEVNGGIQAALEQGRTGPVLVDVHIDYSKRTQFTEGTVKTNLKRFNLPNKARIVSRALWRRIRN